MVSPDHHWELGGRGDTSWPIQTGRCCSGMRPWIFKGPGHRNRTMRHGQDISCPACSC